MSDSNGSPHQTEWSRDAAIARIIVPDPNENTTRVRSEALKMLPDPCLRMLDMAGVKARSYGGRGGCELINRDQRHIGDLPDPANLNLVPDLDDRVRKTSFSAAIMIQALIYIEPVIGLVTTNAPDLKTLWNRARKPILKKAKKLAEEKEFSSTTEGNSHRAWYLTVLLELSKSDGYARGTQLLFLERLCETIVKCPDILANLESEIEKAKQENNTAPSKNEPEKTTKRRAEHLAAVTTRKAARAATREAAEAAELARVREAAKAARETPQPYNLQLSGEASLIADEMRPLAQAMDMRNQEHARLGARLFAPEIVQIAASFTQDQIGQVKAFLNEQKNPNHAKALKTAREAVEDVFRDNKPDTQAIREQLLHSPVFLSLLLGRQDLMDQYASERDKDLKGLIVQGNSPGDLLRDHWPELLQLVKSSRTAETGAAQGANRSA